MNIEKTGKTCIEKKNKGFEKPVDKIKRWKRNIRFIFQRVKYGYCDSDVWSIDYWFLMVMPGMLKQLKDTTHSYPDFCGNTSHVPEYKEIEDRYFEESRKLDQYRDECKDRAIDMFKEWFWDLWD